MNFSMIENLTYLISMSLVLSVIPLMTVKTLSLLTKPVVSTEADHDIEVAHMDNDPHFVLSLFQNQVLKHFLSLGFEPKSYKEALMESCWIEAMQEELNEFEHLKVWELVPRPDRIMIITLKCIFKVKLDELRGVCSGISS
ncbi:retrovirus-related pol polyprotein from transposon TNT 1-94 [Tanacetum coccineum]